jgi:hypothetical protein
MSERHPAGVRYADPPGRSSGALRRWTMTTSRADRHSVCAKECHYVFYECEADSTPGSECRAAYDQCVAECEVD